MNKLVIVSHVIHYSWQEKIWAYGPYLKEIEIWADLFPEVVIASPLREEKPPDDNLFFTKKNIYIAPQIERGGDSLLDKFWQIISLDVMVITLLKVLIKADVIHVRCPGNLGLLGVILSPLLSKKRIAKYAGQWNGFEGETIANKLQRSILKSKWWNSPVTVYGDWPDQPKHVIPFFTSMMTLEQVNTAKAIANNRSFNFSNFKVLFSGRLTNVKRVDVVLQSFSSFNAIYRNSELVILGDGPLKEDLIKMSKELNLENYVKFVGALPYNEALNWFKWADCLLLPSQHSEGWPKVIAEAMCYGVVCIAVDHGQVAKMLDGRGIILHQGSYEEITDALAFVQKNENWAAQIAKEASDWSSQYSLEDLKNSLASLMDSYWRTNIFKNRLS
jgi:glycosyltransferase involved in cell wall biosynthesis